MKYHKPKSVAKFLILNEIIFCPCFNYSSINHIHKLLCFPFQIDNNAEIFTFALMHKFSFHSTLFSSSTRKAFSDINYGKAELI